MPYQSTSQLPPAAQKYSTAGQHAFLSAFNRVHQQTGDESQAFAEAHAAAQHVDGGSVPSNPPGPHQPMNPNQRKAVFARLRGQRPNG